MNLIYNPIPSGTPNRKGYKLKSVKGFVVHWIGCSQTKASVIRNNFARGDRIGATQYIIDYNNGDVIQTMPDDEVTWHVGSTYGYTPLKTKLVGSANPNYYFIGVECCVPDVNGDAKPSDVQRKALIQLAANVCKKFNLNPANQLYRHYDITGKECHRWFVRNRSDWEIFKQEVAAEMGVGLSTKNYSYNEAKSVLKNVIGLSDNTITFLDSYLYNESLITKIANCVLDTKNNGLTYEQAKVNLKIKCGFDDNTMKYLEFYKYCKDLIVKLASYM